MLERESREAVLVSFRAEIEILTKKLRDLFKVKDVSKLGWSEYESWEQLKSLVKETCKAVEAIDKNNPTDSLPSLDNLTAGLKSLQEFVEKSISEIIKQNQAKAKEDNRDSENRLEFFYWINNKMAILLSGLGALIDSPDDLEEIKADLLKQKTNLNVN